LITAIVVPATISVVPVAPPGVTLIQVAVTLAIVAVITATVEIKIVITPPIPVIHVKLTATDALLKHLRPTKTIDVYHHIAVGLYKHRVIEYHFVCLAKNGKDSNVSFTVNFN
jgi:hypothetical protein